MKKNNIKVNKPLTKTFVINTIMYVVLFVIGTGAGFKIASIVRDIELKEARLQHQIELLEQAAELSKDQAPQVGK